MVSLHSQILFGFLMILSSKGEDMLVMYVKQSLKRSSENQTPGKTLWSFFTPSVLSCVALCLQKNGCQFSAYQNHICHGYGGSEEGNSPVEISAIFQVYSKRYAKKKGRSVNHKVTNKQVIKDCLCPALDDGYKNLTNRRTHLFVKKHQQRKSQDEALKVCQVEGATLVKLDTPQKVRLFKKEFRDRRKSEQNIWNGLSDRYDNDTWYWTDGTRLGPYSNWQFGEPHNVHDGKKENCAVITLQRYFNGKWFDTLCLFERPFVCERVCKCSASANYGRANID